jgi:hypothetical protein
MTTCDVTLLNTTKAHGGSPLCGSPCDVEKCLAPVVKEARSDTGTDCLPLHTEIIGYSGIEVSLNLNKSCYC